jgi:menaquinol-cytochrome c reductase iron-sulfur subunit
MPEQTTPHDDSRRRILQWAAIALGALTAAVVGAPSLLFLLAPIFKRPLQVWRSVGSENDFQPGKTVVVAFDDPAPLPWAGVTARTAAWLRRDTDGSMIAFAVNCTHLGCPVRWLQDAELFMCPCHGGVYYNDGTVAAGPPPDPLFRYQVRVRGGQVEVLTGPLPIAGSK